MMQANTTTSSQQYFRTRPKLLAILQMGGAQGQLFTAEQVRLSWKFFKLYSQLRAKWCQIPW